MKNFRIRRTRSLNKLEKKGSFSQKNKALLENIKLNIKLIYKK